jgi:hypothetical protein
VYIALLQPGGDALQVIAAEGDATGLVRLTRHTAHWRVTPSSTARTNTATATAGSQHADTVTTGATATATAGAVLQDQFPANANTTTAATTVQDNACGIDSTLLAQAVFACIDRALPVVVSGVDSSSKPAQWEVDDPALSGYTDSNYTDGRYSDAAKTQPAPSHGGTAASASSGASTATTAAAAVLRVRSATALAAAASTTATTNSVERSQSPAKHRSRSPSPEHKRSMSPSRRRKLLRSQQQQQRQQLQLRPQLCVPLVGPGGVGVYGVIGAFGFAAGCVVQDAAWQQRCAAMLAPLLEGRDR